MASLLRVLAALFLISLCTAWVVRPDRSRVLRPRLGVPAVVAPGESFTLQLESSRPFRAPALTVELERVGTDPIPLALSRAHSSGARHDFDVQVPADLDEGAYTMVVRDGGRVERMPKAVHLRRLWADELCLVQLADLPEFFPDGSGTRRMDALVDEINLVAPDLVVISGDVAYGGSMDRYERLMAALERFDAPVVVVIGNHEYQGLAGFMTHLRVVSHVVDAGPLRIVSANSAHGRDQFTATQLDWIAEALEGAGKRTPIVQLHHPLFEGRRVGARRGAFVELCREGRVPIVLSGHWHADRVFDASGQDRRDRSDFDGPIFSVATAAGAMLHPERSSGGDYHGYRVIRLARERPHGRYAVRSFTYDLDDDGTPDASASHPAGKLIVDPLGPGGVRVTNGWNEAVPRARVWIDLPAGRSGERVEGGRVLGTRARPAGNPGRQVGVEFDLAARASVDLRVDA